MSNQTASAEILCRTDRTKPIRLCLWDDGKASLTFDMSGRDGAWVTVSRQSEAEEMRAFIKDAAEVLGLFVSEQPAVGAR